MAKERGRPPRTKYPDRLLKKLRKEAGLTQQELAKMSFMSQTAISSYEHGYEIPEHHGIDILKALTGVLGNLRMGTLSFQDLSREVKSK